MKKCAICKIEQSLDSFHKNSFYCKPCASKRSKAIRTPEIVREGNLRNHFGIKSSDYNEMFAKQDGKCALCFKPPTSRNNGFFDVDHCHSHLHERKAQTGCPQCIRGLLCNRCNMVLAMLEDNPLLQNDFARHYLKQRPLYLSGN